MNEPIAKPSAEAAAPPERRLEPMTLGGGCFWCLDALFRQVRGVVEVTSGYAGGSVEHPTYEQVCSGTTGHAEVVHLTFCPEEIRYETLLQVFWLTHDPTTLNRQGADVGTQYRSVVYYHSPQQQQQAYAVRDELVRQQFYTAPIVTEIAAAPTFYPAEPYHQDYFARNPYQGYCRAVISPKLATFRSTFGSVLRAAP
jgi:peptide-methionine (S)-S-oxide reductase